MLIFLPRNGSNSFFKVLIATAGRKLDFASSTSDSSFIDLETALRRLCRYSSEESVSPSLSISLSLRSLNFFFTALGCTASNPSPSSDLSFLLVSPMRTERTASTSESGSLKILLLGFQLVIIFPLISMFFIFMFYRYYYLDCNRERYI